MPPKKKCKISSTAELDCLINTSGKLVEVCEMPESDNEQLEDAIECESLYDSDGENDFILDPENDSDDLSDSYTPAQKIQFHASSPCIYQSGTTTSAGFVTAASTSAHGIVSSIVDFQASTLSSKSGFTWSCHPQTLSDTQTPVRNIVAPFTPGPTANAQCADTEEKCFTLFFEDSIIDEIVVCTNKKIETEAAKNARQTSAHSSTVPAEIRALLGIMVYRGCQKDSHLTAEDMWSPITGIDMYRAAMSERRFCFLLRCLCFDDSSTQLQRLSTDKFAPIRKIWDIFIDNCKEMYIPSENLTVDDQLLAFAGRCPFRMYIPNKPAKYGIKFIFINDHNSKYLLGAIPYLGKQVATDDNSTNLGHYYTKELTRPYHNTNRNVTTSNWFTSVPLVTDLLDDCGMTLVGTIKGNKKEIPVEIKEKNSRKLGSSAFLFTNNMTLVSYIPKNTKKTKKLVLLVSSLHKQATLGKTGKPEVIEFYNATKGGADTFDKMCTQFSSGRMTGKWPLCVFYGMINASCINSWIIHSANTVRTGGTALIRRKYMQVLARALIVPWAQHRLKSSYLQHALQTSISTICGVPLPARAEWTDNTTVADSKDPLVRCTKCPKGSNRKTRHRCNKCRHPVCPRHYHPVCSGCLSGYVKFFKVVFNFCLR